MSFPLVIRVPLTDNIGQLDWKVRIERNLAVMCKEAFRQYISNGISSGSTLQRKRIKRLASSGDVKVQVRKDTLSRTEFSLRFVQRFSRISL